MDSIPPQPLLGKKILCIEDEYFIGELYTRALLKVGADVKLVITGDEGLKEGLSSHYDVILLDMMIPNMGGVDVLKGLRAGGLNPLTKVVFVTNTQQPDAVRVEIEKQVDGYFIKAEVTPKQLIANLLDILGIS
jgi:CheY-like chemotaxis protein